MKKYGFNSSRLLISLLALVLIVSVLFSACAKATSTTTQTSTTTTQTSTTTTPQISVTTTSTQKVLKFGAVIDMTQARGLQDKKWFDLFAKLANEAGGWKIGNDTYQVQMVIYDSQGNQTTAKDELTRLVLNDGCKFIIGQISTGSAQVDCSVTEPNKILVVHEDLTNQAAGPQNQYFYTTGNFFGNLVPYEIAQKAAAKGYKSYVSVKPDNQVGRAMDPMLNASWAMGAPNVKYLGTVWVSPTTIDYSPIATKIKSLNPDVVDLMYEGFIPNSVPQTYRALYDAGYKGLILPGLMSQADLTAIVTQTGKAAVEGGMETSMGLDPRLYVTDPRMLSIMDAYVKEYGKMETDAISDVGGFFFFEAAIKHTQSLDPDVIKAYLDNNPAPFQGFAPYPTILVARPDLGNTRTNLFLSGSPMGLIHDGQVVAGDNLSSQDAYLLTIMTMQLQEVYKAYWLEYGVPNIPDKGIATIHFADFGLPQFDK